MTIDTRFDAAAVEPVIHKALLPFREDRDYPDLAQEARIRCWVDLSRPAAAAVPWRVVCWNAAKRAAIDYLRWRSRRPLLPFDDAVTPVVQLGETAIIARVIAAEALVRMDAAERQIARLHFLEGRSFREIAALLGTSFGHSRQLLQRGLDRSRQAYSLPIAGRDGRGGRWDRGRRRRRD